MRAGFSGDAAISVEEVTSLVEDLSIASVLVTFAVLGAIVLYYRWWRSIAVVFPPLALATVFAFGIGCRLRDDLTPAVRASLTDEQRRWADRFVGETLPGPVTLADLPRTFTLGLRDRDGSVGNIVLVYPSLQSTWWDANQMRDFVGGLRAIAAETTPSATRRSCSPTTARSSRSARSRCTPSSPATSSRSSAACDARHDREVARSCSSASSSSRMTGVAGFARRTTTP